MAVTAFLSVADRFMQREGIDMGKLAQIGDELGRKGRTPLYAAIDGQIAGGDCRGGSGQTSNSSSHICIA